MATYNDIKKIKIGDNVFNLYNSDKQLEITDVIEDGISYYPIMGSGNTAAIRQYDKAGFKYVSQADTTTNNGYSTLILGNNVASGTTGNRQGQLQLFDSTIRCGVLSTTTNHLTANRNWYLPDKTGTIALVSDITEAISYPVTSVNSKTGAVSLTAADVGALASNTTYVSKITTTAGAHTTISNKSGAVSFNVPTKTSHLTNDSGFTTNTGTVTGVKINGTTKSPTSGVVDLGTVITSHQTIPVTSVNSKTGAVSLSASDVEAMPATTLLWTNSSPTSSFTAKTVSLDLSAYSAIEIEFKHANSSNSFLYQKFKIPSDDMSLFYMTGKGTYFELESRAVTVTTTGVTFADGRRAQATWTASSDNIRCVPTRIFGIK